MTLRKSRRAVSSIGFAIFGGLLAASPLPSVAASWTKITRPAPTTSGVGSMLLLTDGTVMILNGYGPDWLRLTPDSRGSYINGSWTENPIAPMDFSRLYFESQVLPDGRVWILGGEYSGPYLDSNLAPSGQIWDPVANSWSNIPSYPAEVGGCFQVPVTSNANITAGSNVITGIYSTDRLLPGWTVAGTGIPSGATVVSVNSSTEVHISKNATTTGNVVLQFVGVPVACVGDEPSILVSRDKILVGNLLDNSTYIFSTATNTWEFAANKVYNDPSDEEGWTKQPDGSVVTYDLFQSIAENTGYAEVYHPSTDAWTSISPADGTAKGTLPVLSSPALGYELGPVLRLQDGRVMVIGANNLTALYTPSTNTWKAGPEIFGKLSNAFGSIDHARFGADDAPAALMPNGHVLLAADAGPNPITSSGDTRCGSVVITHIPSTAGLQVGWAVAQQNGNNSAIPPGARITSIDSATQVEISAAATATTNGLGLVFGGVFSTPAELFDFNPKANTISPVSPAIPDSVLSGAPAFVARMLVLPTGQMLFSDSTNQLWVYRPDGAAPEALRPQTKKVVYDGKGVFTLTGTQLNGPSDTSAYGDDVQSDENYPIVRLVNSSENVYYARTANWSSTAVDGGRSKLETVNFTLHPAMKAGKYELFVSAAGISSCSFTVTITQAEVNGE